METVGAVVVTDQTVDLDGEGFSDWYRHDYRRVQRRGARDVPFPALRDTPGTAGSNARDASSLAPTGPTAGERDPQPVVPDVPEASA